MEEIILAEKISNIVNKSWESGEFLEKVTPTTAELLKFWFDESYCTREKNFHLGQKQAIMNIIYLHEVAKINNVWEMYNKFAPDELVKVAIELNEEKYSFEKFCVKMATGTGKTWVMHAIMIWQILNYSKEPIHEGRYTNNFLLIAPGNIVYGRLLDAFKGKVDINSGLRDFEKNDFKLNEELFIPPYYREEIYSFLQNNVKDKESIADITAGGLIAITNWHIFIDRNKEIDEDDTSTQSIIKDLLPTKPGTSSGNNLDVLDSNYLRGRNIEYLSQLDSLMIINDEAHHLHNNTSKLNDVVWQKGIDEILKKKPLGKFQIDFSATPYTQINKNRAYFPHIVVDFDLKNAMQHGLVKLLNISTREAITNIELNYKANRDEKGHVVSLSEGQKIMISAGLKKLNILDAIFKELPNQQGDYKIPKMLIMCEDTTVTPFVSEYLQSLGLADNDILQIDSNRQGEVSEEEWKRIKDKLFNIDNLPKPRVIISVLMLREGFDVNNICVIVPLRSSDSSILLEQIIGRGLRLMFRGEAFEDAKRENRELLFQHKQPTSEIDMLSIVEHPKYLEYYRKLMDDGFAIEQTEEDSKQKVKGDLVSIQLKEGYAEYDLYFPKIERESEEELDELYIDVMSMSSYTTYSLSQLQRLLAKKGETFVLNDALSKTKFGKYTVDANPFSSNTYNEYLQKMLFAILDIGTSKKSKPILQTNNGLLVSYIDDYIRHSLFKTEFNPFENNNWKILLVQNGDVSTFIQKQFSEKLNEIINNVEVSQAKVNKRYFSDVTNITARKKYLIPVQKSIYPALPYPSNKGGLEKAFIEYTDTQAEVESFIKINETYHRFASIPYINEDGLLHRYMPDFIVKTKNKFYIVETKAQNMVSSENVQRKKTAVVEWVKKMNSLSKEQRDNRNWEYIILSDSTFYNFKNKNITFAHLCELNKVTNSEVTDSLF